VHSVCQGAFKFITHSTFFFRSSRCLRRERLC
jgi:hypothetical protein